MRTDNTVNVYFSRHNTLTYPPDTQQDKTYGKTLSSAFFFTIYVKRVNTHSKRRQFFFLSFSMNTRKKAKVATNLDRVFQCLFSLSDAILELFDRHLCKKIVTEKEMLISKRATSSSLWATAVEMSFHVTEEAKERPKGVVHVIPT